MLRLNTIRKHPGATHSLKRLGRGQGSGLGQTAGRGGKGQTARTGSSIRIGFEGGQWPLYRRIPKRGFKNVLRSERAVLNVGELEKLGTEIKDIDLNVLKAERKVAGGSEYLAILGNGELKRAYTVKAHKFSESAKKKITDAGGTAEVVVFPKHPLRKRVKNKKKAKA